MTITLDVKIQTVFNNRTVNRSFKVTGGSLASIKTQSRNLKNELIAIHSGKPNYVETKIRFPKGEIIT